MRQRDDPTERRRRRPSDRKRRRSRRGTPRTPRQFTPQESTPRTPRQFTPQGITSSMAVPGTTLAALVVVAVPAALRAVSGPPREWSLALAALIGVSGCWLCVIAVAHVAASVAAGRIGVGR